MSEIKEFNGRVYKRSGKSGKHFRCVVVHYIHRDVWEFHNGVIPDGYHIHHKDGDPENNDISNLECLSQSDHHKKHWKEDYESMSAHAKTNILTAAHRTRSVDEREAMSKRSKEFWAEKPQGNAICKWCEQEFKSKMSKLAKFCSRRCTKMWHWRNARDERDCVVCDKKFIAQRSTKTRTCSVWCKSNLVESIKRKKKQCTKLTAQLERS